MSDKPLVASPVCQLPPKAFATLDQATIDAILLEGAFSEMAHLPLAQVYGQALAYATAMLDAQQDGAARFLDRDAAPGALSRLGLMPADAGFVSQVLALRDLAEIHSIEPDGEADDGATLGALFEAAVQTLLERRAAWDAEPGRREARFRVTKGDLGYLYPVGIVRSPVPAFDPNADADLFSVFVALPLVAPYLLPEDDCFIEPRLE